MLLQAVATTSRELAATSARGAKIDRLARLLVETESPAETAIVVSWLSGELTQRQIGVGWAGLRELPPAADDPSLTVLEVEAALDEIGAQSGAGSQAARRALVDALLGAATETEQAFLRGVITGELRQGSLAGADGRRDRPGRRASQPRRSGGRRCSAATWPGWPPTRCTTGPAALAGYTLAGRPAGQPDAGPDRGRHRRGVGTRSARPPSSGSWTASGCSCIAMATRCRCSPGPWTTSPPGCPRWWPNVLALPASRTGRRRRADRADRRRPAPAVPGHLGPGGQPPRLGAGDDHLRLRPAAPGRGRTCWTSRPRERRQALEQAIPADGPVRSTPRLVTDDPAAAAAFLADALARGHEGVLAKSLDAPYQAGRRGAGWLKIKPVHTLDLVVLAVEWGSGRRTGLLSNIHLGARSDVPGEYVMLGKTFKGMTDEMLRWQTERFTEAGRRPDRRLGGAAAAGAGGRDRLRRRAAVVPVSGRAGAAVRPGAALPGRQAAGARPTPSTPCAASISTS